MDKKVVNTLSRLIDGQPFQNNTFLVGGCVRDYIMGKECKDYDLCVSLPNGGIRLAEYLTSTYPEICRNYAVFPTYGTAKFNLVIDDICEEIEVVETRKERYDDVNSRNPECVFGTIQEDCFRRDLTINSLYLDISTFEIFDYTGRGVSDIEKHIIKTPCDPDITFCDDPLRMLRVIRFASRYNWDINEETFESIKRNASRLTIISKERIADEMRKILVCDYPRKALNLLKESGLMEHFFPEMVETYNIGQNAFHTGTVWEHTVDVVEKTPPILLCRVAALFHDLGKIKTMSIDENGKLHFYKHELASGDLVNIVMKRLKCPNDIIKNVHTIVTNHMRIKHCGDEAKITDKALRKLKCDMGDVFEAYLEVVDADNKSHSVKGVMPNQIDIIKKRILTLSDGGTDIVKVTLPITGYDVMNTLQIAPGPIVRDILAFVTDAYLENPLITRLECIELIKTYEIYR